MLFPPNHSLSLFYCFGDSGYLHSKPHTFKKQSSFNMSPPQRCQGSVSNRRCQVTIFWGRYPQSRPLYFSSVVFHFQMILHPSLSAPCHPLPCQRPSPTTPVDPSALLVSELIGAPQHPAQATEFRSPAYNRLLSVIPVRNLYS